GSQIPDAHPALLATGTAPPASRCQAPAIGAEGHARSEVGIPTWDTGLLLPREVPNLHRLIKTPRGETPTIGAERHAEDAPGVSANGKDLPTGCGVPKLHLARV